MELPLFPRVEQRPGPATNNETAFDFLARGGRPESIKIRQYMEKWFQTYPVDHRSELKTRLQLKDFREFIGAYFELQVFSILRHSLKCHVEVHPRFPNTNGTVDFRATHIDGQEIFYVEATVCGMNQGILRSNPNEENAIRKIRDSIDAPHSDVLLEADGELRKTLAKNRLIDPIRKLLDSCSGDDVRKIGYYSHMVRTLISEDDWTLEVSLQPPIASDGNGQIIGPFRGGAVDASPLIESALSKKADNWKKKKMDKAALVIAVNICHSDYFPGDEITVIETGFSEVLARVSGVIVFEHATLGNEHNAKVKLYENQSRYIPECLQFLKRETSLAELLFY